MIVGARRRGAAGAVLAALAVAPPWLEARGEAALREAVARRGGGFETIDVEGLGVRIEAVFGVRGGVRAEASRIEARLGRRGVEVAVSGLTLERIAPPSEAPSSERSSSSAPSSSSFDGEAPNRSTSSPRVTALRGVPLSIHVEGPVVLPIDAARIRLHDVALTIDAEGRPSARFGVDVRRGQLWAASTGAMVLRPVDGSGRVRIDGTGRIGDGTEATLAAWVDRDEAMVVLESHARGRLSLRGTMGASRRLTLDADRFPLRTFASLTAGTGIDPADARLSGAIALAWDERVHARLDAVRIDDASLEHRALAVGRIALAPIALDGDVWLRDRKHAEAELAVMHGELRTHVSAAWHDEVLTLDAGLAPISCQALVDGMPAAATGLARGMTLDGEIAGHLRLELEARAFSRTLEANDPPGHIALSFPFLGSCTITADPPRIDVGALVGPYRHRFVDGRGRARERTLAVGEPGFVPLASVPLVAAAFVTLEDAAFWHHDGFDREQIERALWHNVERGRIVRGASTITQQTARNLFLGLDRTLARKLQEALLTVRLEAVVPKARILEIYLNIIELAPGVHGVEDAARFYFGKSARELDVLEAVHLASLAPAPHLYSDRFASGTVDDAWMAELRTQVRRMAMRRLIDKDQTRRALHAQLELVVHEEEPRAPRRRDEAR